MISRVDFVLKTNYCKEVKHYTVPATSETSTITGYVDDVGFASKTYTKLYDVKLPETQLSEGSGYFVQSAEKLTFSLDSDDWLVDYILFKYQQLRRGFYQIKEMSSSFPTIINGIPASWNLWSWEQLWEWIKDTYYGEGDIDVSDYLCVFYDENDEAVFTGFIEADGVTQDYENDIIKISVVNSLKIISLVSEKDNIVYHKPGLLNEQLDRDFRKIMNDVVNAANMYACGRSVIVADGLDGYGNAKYIETIYRVLNCDFSGIGTGSIIPLKTCTGVLNVNNVSPKPTYEQLYNKGFAFCCPPNYAEININDVDHYITGRYCNYALLVRTGSGGLVGFTFISYMHAYMTRDLFTDVNRTSEPTLLSHFRYRRGQLENYSFEIANTPFSGFTQFNYYINKLNLGLGLNTEVIFSGGTTNDSPYTLPITLPAPGFLEFGKEFTFVEPGTNNACIYKIKLGNHKWNYEVEGMPIRYDESNYEALWPNTVVFPVTITFQGTDFINDFSFKQKKVRIGDLLKTMLYMANVRIIQNDDKCFFQTRDVTITDSTTITRISDSDVIKLNIGQNKLEKIDVDVSLVLESDVGQDNSALNAGSIANYNLYLSNKYSRIFDDSKNKCECAISQLFNSYPNIGLGKTINIDNSLYFIISWLQENSLVNIKAVTITPKPIIIMTSGPTLVTKGDVVLFTWTNNNIAASFDVDIIIWKIIEIDGAYTYQNVYQLDRIRNLGYFRYYADIEDESSRYVINVIASDTGDFGFWRFYYQIGELQMLTPVDNAVIPAYKGLGLLPITWNLLNAVQADMPLVDIYFNTPDIGNPASTHTVKIKSQIANTGSNTIDLDGLGQKLGFYTQTGKLGIRSSNCELVYSYKTVTFEHTGWYVDLNVANIDDGINNGVYIGLNFDMWCIADDGLSVLKNLSLYVLDDLNAVEVIVFENVTFTTLTYNWLVYGVGYGIKRLKLVCADDIRVFKISGDLDFGTAPAGNLVLASNAEIIPITWDELEPLITGNVDVYFRMVPSLVMKPIALNQPNSGTYNMTIIPALDLGGNDLLEGIFCVTNTGDLVTRFSETSVVLERTHWMVKIDSLNAPSGYSNGNNIEIETNMMCRIMPESVLTMSINLYLLDAFDTVEQTIAINFDTQIENLFIWVPAGVTPGNKKIRICSAADQRVVNESNVFLFV